MAEFGWAYVAGGAITGAAGPTGSVLTRVTNTDITGHSELIWNTGSNTLEIGGAISGSGVISGSAFFGDGSNLSNVGASMTIKEEGSNLTTGATSINFVGAYVTASNDGNDVTVTVNAGAGGGGTNTIGAAEDGAYSDGLFTDFTTSTTIGTAVDKFNEVLKILAPSPAPALSIINYNNSAGTTVKLSFGSSSAVSGYSSSATTAGFNKIDVSQSYAAAVSGSNYRLGAYDGSTDITGILNFTVAPSVTNGRVAYASGAFGNAETGSLKLELNGTVIHTVNLTGAVGTGNPATGSANSLTEDSGFTNLSVTASSYDGNNSEWYIFKHRTARFKVDTNQQKAGWNYARIVHSIGATDYATNYVEWINDPSGSVNDLAVSLGRIENITLVGSKYLSGVEYNTDATANYKVDVHNLYRNVYAASGTPISFGVTNSSTPSAQSVTDIGAGETNTKILGVTASLDYNSTSLLSGAITANVTVAHPFKNTIATTGSATTGNGFLIDNRTLASSNAIEKFHDESYRKISASYDNQAAALAGTSIWDSETHMTGSNVDGHQDGLLYYNQRLYSPVDGDIPNGGNFGSLSNVESGQPNYAGTSGTRTFYRVLSNSSGADLYNFKIDSTKSGTSYNNSSLSTSNVHFFVKIPGTTGWMDISQNFSYGAISDGNGALIDGATGNDADTHSVTFGTASVDNGKLIMLKILADESWAGYISQLNFTLPSNQSQATPAVLSDIDATDSGTTAKLSFGALNSINGYSNATGSSISLTDYNTNSEYSYGGSESNRRGVFTSAPTLDGILNDAIGAGSGYPVDAFYNGYSGSLVLEVNGLEVHSVNLASTRNAISNNFNANSSGFNLSAVGYSTLSGVPHYTKPYRTGTYQVGADDQNVGWNYARVIHRTDDDQETNYVEWIIDPSGSTDDTAVTTPVLSDFGHTSLYYQSGIAYFASNPTASFAYTASNFYRNTYSTATDAIEFGTTTNCVATNIRITGSGIHTTSSSPGGDEAIAMGILNNTTNCHTTTFEVTGTLQYDGGTSISGGLGLFTARDAAAASTVKHPFKTNRTTSTLTKTSFMVYSGAIGSTNLNTEEYFNTETYRIVSGSYLSQSNTTSSANAWNPQTAMNAVNAHGDGLVTVNGYVLSPLQVGKVGDTRSNAEGSTGLQSPPGNPNYSSLTSHLRTYYRYYKYTSASTVASFTLSLYGDATLVGKTGTYSGSLGASKNCWVEFKVPYDPNYSGADDQSTGWTDVAKIFDASNQPNNDGAGIRSGDTSGEDVTIDGGGLDLSLTLGTRRIKQNQYVIVKVTAHKDWTGYMSRVKVTY